MIKVMIVAAIALSVAHPAAAQRRLFSIDTLATGADYPEAALRRKQQGGVSVHVSIAPDGRPEKCDIIYASDSPILGRATCDLVMQRLRYVPAYDRSGKAIQGEDNISVTWAIPVERTHSGVTDFGGSTPIGSPGRWMTNDDLPPAPKTGAGGVAVRYKINADGVAQSCSILSFVGDKAVADRACGLIERRARFRQPVDEHGNAFATNAQVLIRWRLPGN